MENKFFRYCNICWFSNDLNGIAFSHDKKKKKVDWVIGGFFFFFGHKTISSYSKMQLMIKGSLIIILKEKGIRPLKWNDNIFQRKWEIKFCDLSHSALKLSWMRTFTLFFLPWLLSGVVVCICVRTLFPLPCICVRLFFFFLKEWVIVPCYLGECVVCSITCPTLS